jgi:hypothetical protein
MEQLTSKATKVHAGVKVGIAVAVLAMVSLGVVMGYAIYVGGFTN